MKDAAQHRGVKVLILHIAIFRAHEGWAREGRGAGRNGGRGEGRGAVLGLRGPGGARPPRSATTTAAAVFVLIALRRGRNLAAQWHLARAVGKRFRGPGVPRKAPLCLLHKP